jgi:hypothetical protein
VRGIFAEKSLLLFCAGQEYGNKRAAIAEARGKAEGFRASIEALVQTRFPNLVELARERVGRLQDLAILQQVLVAVGAAQDEPHALRYLQTL